MLNVSYVELNIFETPITSTTNMDFKILDKCKYFIFNEKFHIGKSIKMQISNSKKSIN
jgi:hypothetical protein